MANSGISGPRNYGLNASFVYAGSEYPFAKRDFAFLEKEFNVCKNLYISCEKPCWFKWLVFRLIETMSQAWLMHN